MMLCMPLSRSIFRMSGVDIRDEGQGSLRGKGGRIMRDNNWGLTDILRLHELADGPRFTKYQEDDHVVILRCRFCEQELVFARPTPIDLEIALAMHAEDCQRSEARR